MKNPLLFALALITGMLGGCASDLYPEVDERLTSIPIQPHANEVELFFAGELPKEEYVKVAALETRGGAYITLIKSLQAKARAYGADAILVQEKKEISDVHTKIITDRVTTTTLSSLSGIGIKYKKNLDTGLLPKSQDIEMYDAVSGTFHPLLSLRFSPGGEITAKEEMHESAAVIYNNYIHPYTLRTLKEKGAGWTHRQQEGFVVERELHRDGLLQKHMAFDYDVARRLKEIRIREVYGATHKINFTYNETGQLSKRTILRSSNPYIQEEYIYNASGQASQVLIYNTNLPEKLPLLRSSYTYYTLEEI
ncbi:hypothetical protein [uncultured Pontibacter sp.]|uniref:hypothetical protein n=1 Tax=uncultured Pontibacter sp. TaxID=453356 RepID=UPI00260C35E2|nr:hypothetical protein [uncultured Pontibacter sp.]